MSRIFLISYLISYRMSKLTSQERRFISLYSNRVEIWALFSSNDLNNFCSTGLLFGPNREEQTGEWRNLHYVELHNLYGNSDIIRMLKSRRLRLARHVLQMGDGRRAHTLILLKPEGMDPTGRPKIR